MVLHIGAGDQQWRDVLAWEMMVGEGHMNDLRLLACFALILFCLTGCNKSEPASPIVQKVEAAGSGPLAGIPQDGMEQWLRQHRDVAKEVDGMCAPVRQGAKADWGNTTEGRLCAAARQVAFFTAPPAVTNSGKTYAPGK